MRSKILLLIFVVFLHHLSVSQEIKTFTKADFDLNGPVKACLEHTNYGQEEYYFSDEGSLVKSITRYNKTDYDLTIFRFDGAHLNEKRVEVYRNGVIDKEASFAFFYNHKITKDQRITTEKIVNYLVRLISYNVFYFSRETLQKIESHHKDGIDVFSFNYSFQNGVKETAKYKNGVIKKQERQFVEGDKQVTITKWFEKGMLHRIQKDFYAEDKIVKSEFKQVLDAKLGMYKNHKITRYHYDSNAMVKEIIVQQGNIKKKETHLYVLDGTDYKNWVKKIVRPSKNYWSREIRYYHNQDFQE